MEIIVIGTGMYVSGRQTNTYGTIIPALIEFQRKYQSINKIHLVGTNPRNTKKTKIKINKMKQLSGIKLSVEYYPKQNKGTNSKEYIEVLNAIKHLDCAIIAVPDHLHFIVAKECLKRSIHCLMVKPFTPTIKEAQILIDIANKKKLYCAVEFHKRWDRQNIYLKDLYETNQIGIPLYTWTEYSQRKTIPLTSFRQWVSKSNILQYLAVHYIDLISFITKAKPLLVNAIGQKKWLLKKGLDVHDAVQCNIQWLSKKNHIFNQTILTNWIDPENSSAMSDQKIKFVGTSGRFEADQKERGIKTLFDGKNIGTPNLDFCHFNGNKLGEYYWNGYGIDSIFTYFKNFS